MLDHVKAVFRSQFSKGAQDERVIRSTLSQALRLDELR